MNILEILLIGVALSMDAFGVTLTNGMVYKNESRLKKLSMPLAFGIFQAIMPLIGFYAGSLFISYIEGYTKYLLFGIFLLLGGKMIWDGISEIRHPKETTVHKTLLYKIIKSLFCRRLPQALTRLLSVSGSARNRASTFFSQSPSSV